MLIANMVTDAMISGATMLCKKYERVSPYLFQRVLMLDLDTAQQVFDALVRLSLIINVRRQEDDDEAIIGDVNTEKIKQLGIN